VPKIFCTCDLYAQTVVASLSKFGMMTFHFMIRTEILGVDPAPSKGPGWWGTQRRLAVNWEQ